jgi:predicted unusual protein kinase regulating ubiquinone biosynthesis (AarF/ABC1/UbiB family)
MSYANPKASTKDREELAHLGVKTVMEMLFLYDFIHGDLHPGNILVTRNKVRSEGCQGGRE